MKQSLFILFTFMVAACFLHLTESRSLKYIKSDNPNCDIKRQLRIDQVYSKLVSLGKNGRKFPENPKQLKKFCKYKSMKINGRRKNNSKIFSLSFFQ